MHPAAQVTKVRTAVVAFFALVLGSYSAAAVGNDDGTSARRAAAAGAAPSAIAASAASTESIQHASRTTRSNGLGEGRSLVIGTPTGGGKYPFLVVVYWEDGYHIHDPRGGHIWCHGTMVAPDVVLVSKYCWPDNGYVMVGDSSNSSFMQFRNVTSTEPFHGMVYHPDEFHALFRIEPVTFPGFHPATINRDPSALVVGRELTVVGYGTNYNATSFPGEAYESRQVVIESYDDGFDSIAVGFGPCVGDLGAPMLDGSMSLVGITVFPNCGLEKEWSARVSHVADWIERNSCAMSARKEDIPFCPELVCPPDARLLGFPWALLPNGTGSVVGIRGFDVVRATQWPPPGTPLWRGTTTNVTITALDGAGRILVCQWVVRVAPLEALGEVSIDLPNGNFTTAGRFRPTTWAVSGIVYKMSGRTSDQLRGGGSRVSARLRRGSTKYHGKKLTLLQNQTKGSVGVPSVPLRFDLAQLLSDVELHVEVIQNAGLNHATYKVYGQVVDEGHT